jgi:hypothetical protein
MRNCLEEEEKIGAQFEEPRAGEIVAGLENQAT